VQIANALIRMIEDLVDISRRLVTVMYGPPQDCKGKVWSRRQVCANVFGL
jgi:hypothetical protein